MKQCLGRAAPCHAGERRPPVGAKRTSAKNSNLLENKGAGSLGVPLCNPSSEAKIATFEVSHPCLTAAVSGT